MKFNFRKNLFYIFLLVILSVLFLRHFDTGMVDESLYGVAPFVSESGGSFVASSELSNESYSENGDTISYQYGDFRFALYDGLWWTAVYLEDRNTILQVPLHYGALDIEHVVFSGELDLEVDDDADIYIAIDPNVQNKYYTLALSEINFNLVKGIMRRPVAGCTVSHEACTEREVISCSNNPDNLPIIEFVLEEDALNGRGRVEFDEMCIKVIGNEDELLKAADALILLWYGII